MKILKFYKGSPDDIVNFVNMNGIKREDIFKLTDGVIAFIYYYGEEGVTEDKYKKSFWS